MEKQYSVKFFTSFISQLQQLCESYLNYNHGVEVSGYLSVEIDSVKKERYVLSEIIHTGGTVFSESYCTKSFTSPRNLDSRHVGNHNEKINQPQEDSVQSQRDNFGSYSQRQRGASLDQNNSNQTSQNRSSSSTSVDRHHPYDRRKSQTQGSNFDQSSSRNYQSSPSCSYSVSSEPHFNPDVNSLYSVEGEQVTLPQSWSGDASLEPPASVQSSIPQDEEVIDLDLIDDDIDLTMEEETEQPPVQHVQSESQRQTMTHFTSPTQAVGFRQRGTLSESSQSTVKYTVNLFSRFAADRYGVFDMFSTSPEELNQMLLDFYKNGKKMSGEELKPRTLQNVQSCMDKYLRNGGYPHRITKDSEFQSSRDYLKQRMAELHSQMVQSRVNDEDIELLFQTNQIGCSSNTSLLNSMWFMNSKYLAWQKPMEHINLKWGDVTLKEDQYGREYLERIVRGSISIPLHSKPDNPDRCFVSLYKQYRDLRPKIALDEDYAFYLKPSDDGFFLPEPLPVTAFGSYWKKMVYGSGLANNKKI